MEIEFELYTMASLVSNAKYPIQKCEIKKVTKTQIVLTNNLRFKKSNGRLLKNKSNVRLLQSLYSNQMDNQTLLGSTASITKNSLIIINQNYEN